jgi:hypothetical protein
MGSYQDDGWGGKKERWELRRVICLGLGRDGRVGNDMTQAGELIKWLMTC